MWLSKQMKPAIPTADAELGTTTIAGERAGVMTRGEVRDLPICGPGGYVWLPENGSKVLVVRGGPGGEEQCVAGMQQEQIPRDLAPGEIYLHSGDGCAIYLRKEGTLELWGNLLINGAPYKPCNCK